MNGQTVAIIANQPKELAGQRYKRTTAVFIVISFAILTKLPPTLVQIGIFDSIRFNHTNRRVGHRFVCEGGAFCSFR
jgi:hypothetical protein